jgi:23S rRNA (uracil1939-C5)-methyltransferase
MSPGQRFEAQIEALAFGGDGVAHAPDGRTAFIPYSAPGDRLEAEITKSQKTFVHARSLKLLSPGPGRTEAPCPVFTRCGGCQWQHLDYAAQLKAKESFVLESLRRIGGIADPPLKPIIPSSSPYQYRNKATAQISGTGTAGASRPADDSRLRDRALGFYAASSHELVPLPESGCAIQSAPTDAALRFLRGRAASIPGLRHAAVRGNSLGESLIALVSAAPLDAALVKGWGAELPGLKGVVNNLQPKEGNTVFGAETRPLWGEEALIEELDGLKFRLSASSFFQVNPAQALRLWKQMIAAREWKRGEQVLELFCGVGTLSLPLARRGVNLLGVENWAAAVQDARSNAELNGLRARFECADAEKGFEFLKAPQLLVLDPPRKGLSPQLLQRIVEAKPKELLYVSCDPASLARDLKGLGAAGWKIDFIEPLDMFPQTYHVECLAKLSS